MGLKRDASLAALVLVATILGLVGSNSSPSLGWFLLGGIVTVTVEVLAGRRHEVVREVWERPIVQLVCLCLALGAIATGSIIAPSIVLSVVLGGNLTYLVMLGVVTTTDYPSVSDW